MNPEFYIARRFAFKRRSATKPTFIVMVAVIGIAVGTAALILTLSIVKGFSGSVENKLISFSSHLQIRYPDDQLFQERRSDFAKVTGHHNVTSATPFLEKSFVLRTGNTAKGEAYRSKPVIVKGINEQQQQVFLVASCAASAIPNVLTVSASGGSYFALFGGEYTGNVGAVTADGNNGANGFTSPASSGTFTISANDLVIGWSVQSGTTTTAGSGFTDRSGANFFMYEDGVFAGTTGNATATGVTAWQMLGQAFK